MANTSRLYNVATAVAQATTGSYVDLSGSSLESATGTIFSFVMTGATQNSYFKILGSNDDTTYMEVEAETAVNAGASVMKSGTAHYRFYKVQIKQNVAGGTVSAVGITK
tara:strand:- start:33 stop:359 length:327 start_codon:yes stop_codon:yes gene_type:complete